MPQENYAAKQQRIGERLMPRFITSRRRAVIDVARWFADSSRLDRSDPAGQEENKRSGGASNKTSNTAFLPFPKALRERRKVSGGCAVALPSGIEPLSPP
jgi:hypothetical protein